MNRARPQDRLQPALLDRLTDDDPTNPLETSEMRIISGPRMRDAVLRDRSWLFNTTFLSDQESFELFPEARRSVLNYGLPALSGQTASSFNAIDMEEKVRAAIVDHEPRIIADTLKVEALVSEEELDHHNQISFRISGQLWAQPVPLELLLHTDIDLETGRVDVKDRTR